MLLRNPRVCIVVTLLDTGLALIPTKSSHLTQCGESSSLLFASKVLLLILPQSRYKSGYQKGRRARFRAGTLPRRDHQNRHLLFLYARSATLYLLAVLAFPVQRDLLDFLNSLVLFPPDDTA